MGNFSMLLILGILASSIPCIVGQRQARPVIAGYLPEYRSYINLNNTMPFLTDVMLFSVVPHQTRGMLGGCCLEDHHFQQAREAKELHKSLNLPVPLNLWVTVGGAGRVDWLENILTDPNKRAKVIRNLIRLCEKEDLQGVDMDCMAINKRSNPILYKDLVSFLTEASNAFHDNGLFMSIVVHPGDRISKEVFPLVDRVHLTTYDVKGSDVLPAIRQPLLYLQKLGCQMDKIILGIGAYGRHSDNPNMVKTFSEIVDGMNPQQISDIHSPWGGIMFDDPEMVKQKVDLAHKTGLAGIFFWELGQDSQHSRLGTGGILLETAVKRYQDLLSVKPSVDQEL